MQKLSIKTGVLTALVTSALLMFGALGEDKPNPSAPSGPSNIVQNVTRKAAGIVRELTGFDEITAINPELGGYRNLRVTDTVYVGDQIVTAKEQTVTIELLEQSDVMIGPSSTFKIEDYSNDSGIQKTALSLMDGIVRAIVKKKYGPDEKFQIRTPASTMGVRGTEFIVQVISATETEVHTFKGVVAMAALPDFLNEPGRSVLVRAGEMSNMKSGMQAPAAPKPFDRRDYRRQLWKIAPQLNAPVPVFHGSQAPLPGQRPEAEGQSQAPGGKQGNRARPGSKVLKAGALNENALTTLPPGNMNADAITRKHLGPGGDGAGGIGSASDPATKQSRVPKQRADDHKPQLPKPGANPEKNRD